MYTKRDLKTNPFRILIVEDDPMITKSLERLLSGKNYVFSSVQSGEEVMDAFDKFLPDLILLDIIMLDLSGYDVCRMLRKSKKARSVPVIFITSRNKPKEIVEGFNAGAVDYVTKPFHPKELLARIGTHLELLRIREELKLMNIMKTKFFSIITNDIKETFSGITDVAHFLKNELTGSSFHKDESIKFIKHLLEESEELDELLDNLIEWESIELGKTTFNIEKVNLKEIIEGLRKSFSSEMSAKNIELNISVGDDIYFINDKNAINNIIKRVFSNAVKYSLTNGKIHIEAIKEKGQNIVIIKDEGIGMDHDSLGKLFRYDTPSPKIVGTQSETGAGLGLIICKTLSDKIQGTINVESKKSFGTTVTLKFPDLE
jgi:signal transduction histidine kinase